MSGEALRWHLRGSRSVVVPAEAREPLSPDHNDGSFMPTLLVETWETGVNGYRVAVTGPRLTARGNLHARQTCSRVVRRVEDLPELLQPFAIGPEALLRAVRADVLASLDEALA